MRDCCSSKKSCSLARQQAIAGNSRQQQHDGSGMEDVKGKDKDEDKCKYKSRSKSEGQQVGC